MKHPPRIGRPPAPETAAAQLLLGLFDSYQEAAKEFGCTRSAVQLWAKTGRIPDGRLKKLKLPASKKRALARLFNKVGKEHGLSIGH